MAVPIPDSSLELDIVTRVPRRTVRLVLTDDISSAAGRLEALGYTDVRVLDGGTPAWAAAGNELITGLNSLSKALGEFVERWRRNAVTAGHELPAITASAGMYGRHRRPE